MWFLFTLSFQHLGYFYQPISVLKVSTQHMLMVEVSVISTEGTSFVFLFSEQVTSFSSEYFCLYFYCDPAHLVTKQSPNSITLCDQNHLSRFNTCLTGSHLVLLQHPLLPVHELLTCTQTSPTSWLERVISSARLLG